MDEDAIKLLILSPFLLVFMLTVLQIMSYQSDHIGEDYIEVSEHEDEISQKNSVISSLESNNSDLRSDKQYLNRLVSNYSENRSDLRQERNYYGELSENLSEENEGLEEENNQLEDEVNRKVPLQRVIDYTLQVWDVQVKIVHVFAVSISVTFAITLSLVELNLFGWEGRISIKEGYEKFKNISNRIFKSVREKWEQYYSQIRSLLNSVKDSK